MTTSRKFLICLSAMPIGAAGGFLCALVIVSACVVFGALYGRPSGVHVDWQLCASYVLTAAVVPGAAVGALLLPLAYLVAFRAVPLSNLVAGAPWIAVGVLGFGLIASPALEFFAFIASIIGFAVGCWLAYTRTRT